MVNMVGLLGIINRILGIMKSLNSILTPKLENFQKDFPTAAIDFGFENWALVYLYIGKR